MATLLSRRFCLGRRSTAFTLVVASLLLTTATLHGAGVPTVLREIGREFQSIEADLVALEGLFGHEARKSPSLPALREAVTLVDKMVSTYSKHRRRLQGLEPSLRRSAARKGADLSPIIDEFDRIGIRIRRRARILRRLLATAKINAAPVSKALKPKSAKTPEESDVDGPPAEKDESDASSEFVPRDAGTLALLAEAERLMKQRPATKAPEQARCGLEGPDHPGLKEGQVLFTLRSLRSDMDTPNNRFWSNVKASELEASLTFGLGRHAWATLYLPDVNSDTTLRNAAATVVEFSADFTDFFSAGLWFEHLRPRWTWTVGLGLLSVSHDEANYHPLRSNQNDAINALPPWDYARYRHQTLCCKRTWHKLQAGFLAKHVDWNRSFESKDILEWGLVTEYFATPKLAIAAEWLKAKFSWDADLNSGAGSTNRRIVNLGVQLQEGNWRFRLESRFLNSDDTKQSGFSVSYRF